MEIVWGKMEEVKRTTGVSSRVLRDWCKKGWVRIAKFNQRNLVYRIADVDEVLKAIAEGRSPRKARGR